MSECVATDPEDAALRPPQGQADRSPDNPSPLSDATIAQHGVLGRFDVEDDPAGGSALYDAVVSQDTSQLIDGGWLDRVEAITRLEARLAALKAEAIAGFDQTLHGISADLGHRYPEPGDREATAGERRWHAGDLRSVSDEICLVLNLHRGAATRRIHTSCELVHNFPATWHALIEGDLTERAAFTIVAELSVLDGLDDLHAAEAEVLDWARKHPLQQIKQAAQTIVARRSPAATDKAHKRALDERSVRMHPGDHGTAALIHTQDALDAAAIMTSLSRAAARCRRNGDTRTIDQLRADIALTRLLPRTKRHTRPANTHPAADSPHPDATAHPDTTPDPDGTADTSAHPADEATGAPNHSPRDCDDPDHATDRRTTGANTSADENTSAARDGDGPMSGGAGAPVDDDMVDELGRAVHGADAMVVIHATGAELHALINGQTGTGGEAEHYGPIPQNSLRKHLLKALTDTLLPNLANAGAGPAIRRSGSRLDIRITDQPPDSDPDRYTPSAALDRYVRLRDRTCRFPGVRREVLVDRVEVKDLDRGSVAAGLRS